MFYSETLLRTIAWEDSLSDSSDELFQREEKKSGYIGVFLEKNVVEHQKITDNHTKKHPSSQGSDFASSSMCGKVQESGLLKSSLWYTSLLSRANIHFFSFLNSPWGTL